MEGIIFTKFVIFDHSNMLNLRHLRDNLLLLYKL